MCIPVFAISLFFSISEGVDAAGVKGAQPHALGEPTRVNYVLTLIVGYKSCSLVRSRKGKKNFR